MGTGADADTSTRYIQRSKTMRKKVLSVVLTGTMAAMMLAGCGGSSSSTSTSGTNTSGSTTS